MQDLHSHPLSGSAGLLHGKASHEIFSRSRAPCIGMARIPFHLHFPIQKRPDIRSLFIAATPKTPDSSHADAR